MTVVNMHDAKTRLSKLVAAIRSGAEREVVIAINGTPAARLVRGGELVFEPHQVEQGAAGFEVDQEVHVTPRVFITPRHGAEDRDRPPSVPADDGCDLFPSRLDQQTQCAHAPRLPTAVAGAWLAGRAGIDPSPPGTVRAPFSSARFIASAFMSVAITVALVNAHRNLLAGSLEALPAGLADRFSHRKLAQ